MRNTDREDPLHYAIDITPTLVTKCSEEEDRFAMAVIEYAGNVGAAYQMVYGTNVMNPTAKGLELLAVPHIQQRILELRQATQQATLITVEGHLVELAAIRDLAKRAGSLKVSLAAEVKRGEVAGYYVKRVSDETPQPQTDRLSRLADRLKNLQRSVVTEGVTDVQDVHEVVSQKDGND